MSEVIFQSKSRPFRDFMRRLVKEQPIGAVSLVFMMLFCLVALFADALAPYHYLDMTMMDRLKGPSSTYPLGTDHIGRDVLTRLLYGAQVSIGVGFAATVFSVLVAVLIGGVAGFLGGKFDLTVQRFVDAWMSFPGLLLLLRIMTIVEQGVLQIIVVLGVTSGIANSRVIRSAVIAIKENVYFEAARAIGAPPLQIMLRHVLPNIMAPVIVIFSITIGGVIIAEASAQLSRLRAAPRGAKLGIDAQPGGPSIHGDGAASGDVAGGLPDGGGFLFQHVWRCHA